MDWQLTCRVCLESGDMVSLFDWDENNEQLADKYTYCCGVEVAKTDSLPTLICLNCVDRLTFSYQFKQQCLASNDTLKECLEEFVQSSAAVAEAGSSKRGPTETETITIKQENGIILQYELPVENEPTWQRTVSRNTTKAIVTKAPEPKKRGRPRKYPNEQGQILASPYQRKKPVLVKPEPQSLTSLLSLENDGLKTEPGAENDEQSDDEYGDDPDFNLGSDDAVPSEDDDEPEPVPTPRKRGRPRKIRPPLEPKKETIDEEDVLLKETIMAYSEPIPDHILNPKPKEKKKYPKYHKKKYNYEKTHTCETCGSSFTSNASLQAHIRRHLGIKPFVCSVCGYSCVLNMELRRHMIRHTGAKPYKCRICDRRFGDFGSRQKHESECGKCFPYAMSLRRHMDRHAGSRQYQCRFCDRRFVESGDRVKHESVCGYSCVLKEALKRHMLVHTGEKPYKCRICERRFGDFGTRQKHERLHMGVRPYQCSVCGKSFTYSYVLANHMLTHTGEKKFHCAPCNKKFTKAHHLKYHNKVHHKDVYQQQQLEQEAKRLRQQVNVSGLSGVVAGQIDASGQMRLVQLPSEDGDQEGGQMQVVEMEAEDSETKETDRAVADMQAVVMDSEFCIEDDK